MNVTGFFWVYRANMNAAALFFKDKANTKTIIWGDYDYYCIVCISLWLKYNCVPLALCLCAGFVESYVDYLLPVTACKFNHWTTEAASETKGKRPRAMSESRTAPFGCTNFGTQREFVPAWFAPGPFLLHIYTPLPHKSPLEWQLPFLDHKHFYLNREKKKKQSKSNYIRLNENDQPHWTLNGMSMPNKN